MTEAELQDIEQRNYESLNHTGKAWEYGPIAIGAEDVWALIAEVRRLRGFLLTDDETESIKEQA